MKANNDNSINDNVNRNTNKYEIPTDTINNSADDIVADSDRGK